MPARPKACAAPFWSGVDAIEHGNEITAELFELMTARGVTLCPTLAAGDAIARYRGWNGAEPAPAAVQDDRKAFALARAAGVKSVSAVMSVCSLLAKLPAKWTCSRRPGCRQSPSCGQSTSCGQRLRVIAPVLPSPTGGGSPPDRWLTW